MSSTAHETGREMAAGPGDALDEKPAKLPRHVMQSPLGHPAEIGRSLNPGKQGIIFSRIQCFPLESGCRGVGQSAGDELESQSGSSSGRQRVFT